MNGDYFELFNIWSNAVGWIPKYSFSNGVLNSGTDQPHNNLQGWICPRCGVVHSPFTRECYCPAPSGTCSNKIEDIKWRKK